MVYTAINFLQQTIEKIQPPQDGKERIYYKDTKQNGLILDVTNKGSKTYYLYMKVNKKPKRIRIGSIKDITVEQARNQAKLIRANILLGLYKEECKIPEEYTFGYIAEQYMERYSKQFKKSWKGDQQKIDKHLSRWLPRKINTITKKEVIELQEHIREHSGKYQSNGVITLLCCIFNKAIYYGLTDVNPVRDIQKYKEVSRERFLKSHELPVFFNALDKADERLKNFVLLALYTGVRKKTILAMKWKDIDLQRAEWHIETTKNGDPLTVPLSMTAMEILLKMKAKANSVWVFPSKTDKTKHWDDTGKEFRRLVKGAGIQNLRIHDLRRSLGSWQAMTGSSTLLIGKSLNIKTSKIVSVYARLDTDSVRESIEKATKAIQHAGLMDQILDNPIDPPIPIKCLPKCSLKG